MFVSMVCTGRSTISCTPTAAARWNMTSQRSTSGVMVDSLRTDSRTNCTSWSSSRWRMLAIEPVDRSSTRISRWPSASRRSARCEPMKPAPPVISTFMVANALSRRRRQSHNLTRTKDDRQQRIPTVGIVYPFCVIGTTISRIPMWQRSPKISAETALPSTTRKVAFFLSTATSSTDPRQRMR